MRLTKRQQGILDYMAILHKYDAIYFASPGLQEELAAFLKDNDLEREKPTEGQNRMMMELGRLIEARAILLGTNIKPQNAQDRLCKGVGGPSNE